ncbi:uracil-DNA glycosylase [Coraliomargarita sp. SDUM461003]|uniref:Type-4 uracil-DNA glycosylase n=1 Tax=Thalassobacterium maritimum TaxID=3041265 RepID=A0ABU1B1P8_9BACT|nr:uracil-DNA glycosylase [Coraliomargarita sp. SDUM461003]MDQ8209377.1 uracil-DNA glycosylase [Coraliomargarita sp. SDUM461003]
MQHIYNLHPMSSGLEAIAIELRRLQRDGVNRVFIEDDTMRLITSRAAESSRSSATSSRQERNERNSAPAQHGDLKALLNDNPTQASSSGTTKAAESSKAPPLPEPPQIKIPYGDATTQLAWLREQVNTCEVCQQHLSKEGKLVFGAGSHEADILFCGEAPGTEEELTGEPAAGKAGQLLVKIISAMGLSREEVYITNILKWRPEHDKPYGNRPPTIEEMQFSLPYLKAQIEIIKPKVIVALGNAAVNGLLGPDPERKLGSVRGTWASFEDIPVMITFHPSYLLRNGTLKTKRMVWEDMLKVMDVCELAISEKQRGFFLPKA